MTREAASVWATTSDAAKTEIAQALHDADPLCVRLDPHVDTNHSYRIIGEDGQQVGGPIVYDDISNRGWVHLPF